MKRTINFILSTFLLLLNIYKNDCYFETNNINEELQSIIVTFDESVSKNKTITDIKLKNKGFNNFNLISSGKKNVYLVRVKKYEKAYSILKNIKQVFCVEKDFVLTMDNDPLSRSSYDPIDYANIINLSSAWNYETGSANVKVGILDTGIDSGHPSLQGKVSTSLSAVFNNGQIIEDNNPQDLDGHGTAVAGFIAAQQDQTNKVVGVCQNVTLVSLKICNSVSDANVSNAIAAINYAKTKNIPILNISYSWKSSDLSNSTGLLTSIQNYGGLVICSAGNANVNIDDSNNSNYPIYPAIYNLNNLIVVGNSTALNERYSSSSYGITSVDIFAPGTNVNCLTSTSTGYAGVPRLVSATSYSTPLVAGVAALLKSNNPSLSVSKIKEIILGSSAKYSSLSTYCVTGGRLDAYNALYAINHTHSYSYVDRNNNYYHIKQCNLCYYNYNENHTWVKNNIILEQNQNDIMYIPGYSCYYCGAYTNIPPELM